MLAIWVQALALHLVLQVPPESLRITSTARQSQEDVSPEYRQVWPKDYKTKNKTKYHFLIMGLKIMGLIFLI